MTATLTKQTTLTFNTFLDLIEIAPSDVKLMRHADKDGAITSPYRLWLESKGTKEKNSAFILYQSLQTDKNSLDRPYVASFVVTPDGETVFVGLYENKGSKGRATQGTLCPVSGLDMSDDHNHYELIETSLLQDWAGRVVIDWGKGTRAWLQNADNDSPKAIILIRESFQDEQFPSVDLFDWPVNELHSMPESWKMILKHYQGIYLLVCQDTGKQYVGSATGKEGFYQRWQAYQNGGHGGNDKMKSHQTSGYRVKIIQAFPVSDRLELGNDKTIEKIENRWMDKLGTRKYGLNTAWES